MLLRPVELSGLMDIGLWLVPENEIVALIELVAINAIIIDKKKRFIRIILIHKGNKNTC